MAKKEFTDVAIELCEKKLHFKRVTNETLTKFSDKAEKEYEETVKQFMSEVISLEERTSHKRLIPVCHADFDRQIPLIALVDGKIAGLARLAKVPLTAHARIVMQVADAYQKQGLGQYFMEKCLKIASIEKIDKVVMKFFKENTAMTKLATVAGFEMKEKEEIVDAVKVF